MIFDEPIDWTDALKYQGVKRILPTVLSAEELRNIPAAIRERSSSSARVTNADFIDKFAKLTTRILNPSVGDRGAIEGLDPATARRDLKDYLDSIRYEPTKPGTIQDLSSDGRLDLIVKMNVGFARGFGQRKAGTSEAVLDQWPAQELYRREERVEPRDWPDRWEEAGGDFYDGRMIALKTDDIWTDISAFDLPYPPFDYNSGMDVRDVDYDTCVDIGLIDPDDPPLQEPDERDFNEDLQSGIAGLAMDLKGALLESLGSDLFDIVGDVIKAK